MQAPGAPKGFPFGALSYIGSARGIRTVAMNKSTIAVIEDEADLREVLEINLSAEGARVLCFSDGESGLAALRQSTPDLLLLDLMLPGIDGIEVCRLLREDPRTRSLPVIMITAKGRESDIVLGLGIGADDYIAKPFHVAELVARCRALLRRSRMTESQSATEVLSFGPLTLDRPQHSLKAGGTELGLTATEFRLLEPLMLSPGRVFSRELLRELAIGRDVYVDERTVDTHVSSLRRKLGRFRRALETVWGVGYRFNPSRLEN